MRQGQQAAGNIGTPAAGWVALEVAAQGLIGDGGACSRGTQTQRGTASKQARACSMLLQRNQTACKLPFCHAHVVLLHAVLSPAMHKNTYIQSTVW